MLPRTMHASQPTPIRILVVEDEEGDAALVKEILREIPSLSCKLEFRTHLSGALEVLAREHVDLVLLDLALPDSLGLEGLTTLQREYPLVPVVIMTGRSEESVDLAALQRGAHGYLVKDEMSPPLLSRTIRHAIERSRMIIELNAARDAARHLATHDVLTGIANRALLDDRLRQAVENARRSSIRLAVLVVDLNRFKEINDTFGHSTGDAVLRCVAERFTRQVRRSDTIARLGGDEFALVLTNLQREMDAARVAQKLIDALARPISVSSEQFHIGASIGIACMPRDGHDAEGLLKKADLAMYHAKRVGGSLYQFHNEEMDVQARERLEIENRLADALRGGEFQLYYQPQVELRSRRIVGAEALIRWIDPNGGIRSPATFLPIAEETGQIVQIGEWVLQAACRAARQWVDAGYHGFRVSVNVSARQLRQVGFDRVVEDALRRSRLRPRHLAIELTETTLVDDSGATAQVLHALQGGGIHISIDDFGQGHAALAYLKRVPCDELKIDRAFVCGLPDDARDATIASAIVGLSHGLGLATVAEGVETIEQLRFLEELGCEGAQGYLFSPPLPAVEFTALLAHGIGDLSTKPPSA